MTMTEVETMLDRFVRFLETAEDTDELLDPQVFVDYNVPHWRFQTQGAEILARQLKDDAPNGAKVTTGRPLATPTGFVVEADYVQDDQHGDDTRYRTMWAVETRDGRIAEIVLYCTGEWDKATQARQAAEAPMIQADKR
jgi:hypothetical protein